VLIEDYPSVNGGGNCLCHHIKIWADRYPFQGETKGSSSLIQPGRFCLIGTSNFSIEQCFTNGEDVAAIKRRFREIELTKTNRVLITHSKARFSILEGGKDEIETPHEEWDQEWWNDQWKHEREVEEARNESMEIDEQREERIMAGEEIEDEEW
jgi:hypothetical protein